ncbi:SDR family NAD(P)-dependent oxidoreductase [Parafrankia sp. EUN1f]|uniref:SDR family NAD(P)-dependent oxidoreductase n=1 Tax=Parafrankia sp. EUN1f TaxID=102897 RepID=UPI0001C44231|nr:SDR family NAD(P)-dependent oxidoreductase [Parafrankia sp. EUN1f]EFC85793.1 conserved hypothetical protein [Parafrankia sp. EUN1f]
MDLSRSLRLDGRVVVLTGASSDLGVGSAGAPAPVGGTCLVPTARRAVALEEVADELRATDTEVRACQSDVSDPQICEVAAAAVEQFGPVDRSVTLMVRGAMAAL